MLLDTCVVSDIAKPRPPAALLRWFEETEEAQMHLSVLTLGEIARGCARLPPGRKRTRLTRWLAELRSSFSDRVLGVDSETAETWGRIAGEAERRGRIVAVIDGLIAATAARHGLAVVTRNVSDFEPTRVEVLNPYGAGP